jgi:hypothetical protein
MSRQGLIRVAAMAAIVLGTTAVVKGDGLSISVGGTRAGIGASIGLSLGGPAYHEMRVDRPFHRHSRIVYVPSPRRPIVLAPVPHRHVDVALPPAIVAGPGYTASELIVWVTNSNGSQIAVRLTRRGPGYVGPRCEYYPAMPTNEQLRMVYGF